MNTRPAWLLEAVESCLPWQALASWLGRDGPQHGDDRRGWSGWIQDLTDICAGGAGRVPTWQAGAVPVFVVFALTPRPLLPAIAAFLLCAADGRWWSGSGVGRSERFGRSGCWLSLVVGP